MEEYSLILLIDCWTSFEGVFVNKWSYCWFPRDIMAATLDCTNKSISLHCELNLFHVNFSRKILFYYHSTWPPCHVVANEESIKDTKCPHCNNCLHSNKRPCSIIILILERGIARFIFLLLLINEQ